MESVILSYGQLTGKANVQGENNVERREEAIVEGETESRILCLPREEARITLTVFPSPASIETLLTCRCIPVL